MVESETVLDSTKYDTPLESLTQQGAAKDILILAALAAVTIAVAWPSLHDGLWLDEYLSVNSSTAPDVVSMVKNCFGRQDDYHPPLAYIFLHLWMKMFGNGDFAVKVPSLLYGLATIPALYWLGRVVHSARVGLLMAFFFSVSPLAAFLTCQCRGYALATLLSTLCLAFFVKLQSNATSAKGQMPSLTAFAGVALSAAALCYTEYVGCVLIPCLGVATLLIAARKLAEKSENSRHHAVGTIVRCLGSLAIGSLLFAPWIPSVLNQVHGALYAERTPLTRFPEVFYWNVMNLLPIHIGLGPLFIVALVALYLLKRHVDKKLNTTDESAPARSEAQFFKFHYLGTSPTGGIDADIVLWCATIIPCCLMGYITNWWTGYFRYIYPYAPAAWALVAIAVFGLFWTTHDKLKGPSKLALIASVAIMSAVNLSWNLWHAQLVNSGLFTVAKEAKQGKFDGTAIIILPDVIGPTIGYYLPEVDRKAHNIGIFGFAKWDDPQIPFYIPDIAKEWLPDTLVPNTMAKIGELPGKGFKFVALARDSDKQIDLLSSPKMPRRKRMDELIAALNGKYKLISTKHYDAATEDVTVLLYVLSPTGSAGGSPAPGGL